MAKRRSTALAVRERSKLDVAFDVLIATMNDDFTQVETDMELAFKEIINAIPSSDDLLIEIDTVFDMIEQGIDELVEKLDAERGDDDLTVQASVAFAKELSATKDAADDLWRATYAAGEEAAELQGRVAAVYATLNISRRI